MFAATALSAPHWPKRLARTVELPVNSIFENLEITARQYPGKRAIWYYGTELTYAGLLDMVERLSTTMIRELGIARGDRVYLWLQNSPQYVIAAYAAWRAGAIVVPLSPMLTEQEFGVYHRNAEGKLVIGEAALLTRINKSLRAGEVKAIACRYEDFAVDNDILNLPDALRAPQGVDLGPILDWNDATKVAGEVAPAVRTAPDEHVLLPYTSGTTGVPKGCVISNRAIQATAQGAVLWGQHSSGSVHLATLPFFHGTGIQHSMNAPIASGGSMIILTRWDRTAAARLIRRFGVTTWICITAMIVDFMAEPDLNPADLATVRMISGGGAPIPEAVHARVRAAFGTDLIEGYGLTETISQTHSNPPDRPKAQCIGIPTFNTQSVVVDPETLRLLGPDAIGEILVSGPQVLATYWRRPEEDADIFVEIEGHRFFRTGDLGFHDAEGYFFVVDRLKRMINASGFKVWPAEVENQLYQHPQVLEACVIAVADGRRGETVKALVVRRGSEEPPLTEDALIAWAKERMAAYKYPRQVEFVDALPKLASGKVDWRRVQETHAAAAIAA